MHIFTDMNAQYFKWKIVQKHAHTCVDDKRIVFL